VWIDTSAYMPRYYSQSFVHFLRTFGKHKCIWAATFPS